MLFKANNGLIDHFEFCNWVREKSSKDAKVYIVFLNGKHICGNNERVQRTL